MKHCTIYSRGSCFLYKQCYRTELTKFKKKCYIHRVVGRYNIKRRVLNLIYSKQARLVS